MTPSDVAWFRAAYGAEMEAAVSGSPITVAHLMAVACQETGYLWSVLRRKGMSPSLIAALCCGDTLDDTKGRRAFPRNAAALKAATNGATMFDIARKAILDLADVVPGYAFARKNPDKFAHGFGIWQYDLQFFKVDPDYFLRRRYERPGDSARKAVGELMGAVRKLGLAGKARLSDAEFARCAIVYNSGRYDPAKGLKQGHRNDAGKYYGECIAEFLTLCNAARAPDPAPPEAVPLPPEKPARPADYQPSGYEAEAIQTGLNKLGYAAGAPNGAWGRLTIQSASGFQHDHGLPVTGLWSVDCQAALDRSLAEGAVASVSAERGNATADDLRAKGSTEIKAADKIGVFRKILMWLGIGGGAAKGADETGAVDKLTDLVGQGQQIKNLAASVSDLVHWILPYWPVLALAAGAYLLWMERDIIAARVAAHRSGANTGR